MKTLLTALLITLASTTAQAESNCTEIGKLAEKVMEVRQGGMPLRTLMESVDGNAMVMAMAKEAYDTPNYSTDRIVKRQITEMGNRWYMACLKNREGE